MSFSITIGGVDKTALVEKFSLRITMTANGRSTAAFNVLSTDGTYRPAQDSEVIITENGTRIFAGLVDTVREAGIAGGKGIPAIRTAVSCFDFNQYPERRFVNEVISAGTLKSQLERIVTYLSEYGVTLSGSQVDGPSLANTEWKYVKATEVLNQLVSLTADSGEPYIWQIDNFKVLSAYQPSTVSAPFDLSGSTIAEVIGDIEIETDRHQYANKIIVKVPNKAVTGAVETFYGDGSTSEYTLQHGLTSHRSVVYVDGVPETLATEGTGFDLAVFWLYHPDTNTIERVEAGVANPPADGSTISITFDGTLGSDRTFSLTETIPSGNDTWDLQYPIVSHTGYVIVNGVFYEPLESGPSGPTWTISADRQTITRLTGVLPAEYSGSITYTASVAMDGASAEDAGEIASVGTWERVLVVEDIPTDTTLQALAEAELAKRIHPIKTVKYTTHESGVLPGMSQTINVSRRNVNDTAVITEVQLRDKGKDLLERQITAMIDASQTNLDRGYRDEYKIWKGDKLGASASVAAEPASGPSAAGTIGPALPYRSVQFNDSGVFGGDAEFLYDKDTNSVICGLANSITATDVESCQVFGNDNHIADGGASSGILIAEDTNAFLSNEVFGWAYWDIDSSGTYDTPWTLIFTGAPNGGPWIANGLAIVDADATFVQGKGSQNTASSGTHSVAFDSNVVAGNLIVVAATAKNYGDGRDTTTPTAIEDSQGNTYTRQTSLGHPDDPTKETSAIYTATAGSSGPLTVTFTACDPGTTTSKTALCIAEAFVSSPTLVAGSTSDNDAYPTSGDLVMSDGGLIFGFVTNYAFQSHVPGGTGGPTEKVGTTVVGVNTTVTATRAFSAGLDGDPHVDGREGTFWIHGDLIVDGTTTISTAGTTTKEEIIHSIVTSGGQLVMSNGYIVFS